jgi:CheY-like chemotaxis protein
MVAGRNAEVLVADDDDEIRSALSEVLQDEGYLVTGVTNGSQALDYLRNGHIPSVILLDLWMPVMDGPTLCQELMRDPELARIPVIILTATQDPRMAPAHATAFFTKPVPLERLLARIETLTCVDPG